MNIYKITNSNKFDRFVYWAGAVVVACNEEQARHLYPDNQCNKEKWWENELLVDNWCAPEKVALEWVGLTGVYDMPTVILAEHR